jgi:hypothetical protein
VERFRAVIEAQFRLRLADALKGGRDLNFAFFFRGARTPEFHDAVLQVVRESGIPYRAQVRQRFRGAPDADNFGTGRGARLEFFYHGLPEQQLPLTVPAHKLILD